MTIINLFSPKPALIFEETPLNAEIKTVPHGSLDLLVVTDREPENTVGFLLVNDSMI